MRSATIAKRIKLFLLKIVLTHMVLLIMENVLDHGAMREFIPFMQQKQFQLAKEDC